MSKRSDLNQRIMRGVGPLAQPFGTGGRISTARQPPARNLLFQRGGASHSLGHVTYPTLRRPSLWFRRRARAIGDGSARRTAAIGPGADKCPRPALAMRLLKRWLPTYLPVNFQPPFVDQHGRPAPDGHHVLAVLVEGRCSLRRWRLGSFALAMAPIVRGSGLPCSR